MRAGTGIVALAALLHVACDIGYGNSLAEFGVQIPPSRTAAFESVSWKGTCSEQGSMLEASWCRGLGAQPCIIKIPSGPVGGFCDVEVRLRGADPFKAHVEVLGINPVQLAPPHEKGWVLVPE